MPETTDTRVPTHLRALLILEMLGQSSTPMSATEIGRAIGVPKQTTHRLCRKLAEEGFLQHADGRGQFRPDRRARTLGSGLLHTSVQHLARRQVLQWLAEQVGETVSFAIPDDRGMSYQDRVETQWPFRIDFPIGNVVPFYCTASGKAFLASLPRQERRRLVNVMQLTRHTPKTLTDPEALLEELQVISRRGYTIDTGEYYENMVAISVPVRDDQGRYFASLTIFGPSQRLPVESLPSHLPLLVEAAARLNRVIFE